MLGIFVLWVQKYEIARVAKIKAMDILLNVLMALHAYCPYIEVCTVRYMNIHLQLQFVHATGTHGTQLFRLHSSCTVAVRVQ